MKIRVFLSVSLLPLDGPRIVNNREIVLVSVHNNIHPLDHHRHRIRAVPSIESHRLVSCKNICFISIRPRRRPRAVRGWLFNNNEKKAISRATLVVPSGPGGPGGEVEMQIPFHSRLQLHSRFSCHVFQAFFGESFQLFLPLAASRLGDNCLSEHGARPSRTSDRSSIALLMLSCVCIVGGNEFSKQHSWHFFALHLACSSLATPWYDVECIQGMQHRAVEQKFNLVAA